ELAVGGRDRAQVAADVQHPRARQVALRADVPPGDELVHVALDVQRDQQVVAGVEQVEAAVGVGRGDRGDHVPLGRGDRADRGRGGDRAGQEEPGLDQVDPAVGAGVVDDDGGDVVGGGDVQDRPGDVEAGGADVAPGEGADQAAGGDRGAAQVVGEEQVLH